jgi:hypothetical protein
LVTLNQYLSRFSKEVVNVTLYILINHQSRFIPIWAWKVWGRAKQATNQGAFTVYLAPAITKMWATEFGQRCVMVFIAYDWKSCNFISSCRDRPATIVAPRFAYEYRNMAAEESDFLTVFCH